MTSTSAAPFRASRLTAASASRFTRRASCCCYRALARQAAVDGKVVLRHARGGKALLEALAHGDTVEPGRAAERVDRGVDRIDQEAGAAVLDHLRHRALRPADHRRAAGHGLDHGEAEGLGPVDREEERRRVAEERGLLRLAHLADELD